MGDNFNDEYDINQQTQKKEVLADEIAEAIFKDNQDDVDNQSENIDGMKSNMSESNKTMCRICFSDECEKDNPLISPCKCSGSMSHVHIKCLR